MRRTLQINLHTTIIILFVVSWLPCAFVRGFPATNRNSGESMSARRRGGDDLIVGSDFINMFIGPSPSVRSRRYPLVRADIVDPRQGHSSLDSEERTPSRQLRPPSEGRDFEDHSRRRTNNVYPNQKLSGLIKSQDRQNYRFESQDQHNSNKVDHSEESQRRGGTRFRFVHSEVHDDPLSAVTEDAEVRGVMASEARVFGGRTLPRTSSNTPSSVTTSAPSSVDEEVTENYSTSTSDDFHSVSTEIYELNRSGKRFTIIDGLTHTNEASEDIDIQNNHDIVTRKTHLAATPPKFSVSSSTKKLITNDHETLDNEKLQNNHSPQSNNEATSTSQNNVVTEEGTTQEVQTKQTQDDYTPSMTSLQTSTDSNSIATEVESTTFASVTDSDVSTEHNEEWSTKADDYTSEPTVTANVEEIPDGVQFQKVGIPQGHEETAVKVVSVRVSSSVVQVSPSDLLLRETTAKKSPIVNTLSEDPASLVDSSSKKTQSDTFTLETEDRPPATSVERSELLVEESSPSEVTAVPFTSYTSYISSNFQSASTNYYQPPLEHTSTSSHVVSSNYQSSLTPTKSERKLHYFNHAPRNHRNPTIEALQRSSEDSPHLTAYDKANFQDVNARQYASQALPRTQESILQALRQEPASVAESIQRSIITRQGADRSESRSVSSRSQFHQDKNGFADGGYQGEETRDRKRYSQPERVWGEPEKVYGEPEKVYGEPEKVYGEPEKVYGEPEMVYGEPEKVYGEPEKNYEVDEAVSVQTNGRAHGVQPTQGSTLTPAKVDSPLKMIDSKQQDPNHKFGYVVEGRNFRKYRVEERTSDGFIVGEYGVVSHDDGSLRGVRYTADDSINPRLIYDTLVKFLSL